MRRQVVSLIAIVEREGYADVPSSCIDDETEIELAQLGYAIGLSDARWLGGYRIYGPESIQAGNYRLYVPPTALSCAEPRYAQVPDARDFDLEAVLRLRGELRSH